MVRINDIEPGAHTEVFGTCDNFCKVPTMSKGQIESALIDNMAGFIPVDNMAPSEFTKDVDSTYADYPILATITNENVKPSHIAVLSPNPNTFTQGYLTDTYDGVIKLYCEEIPKDYVQMYGIYLVDTNVLDIPNPMPTGDTVYEIGANVYEGMVTNSKRVKVKLRTTERNYGQEFKVTINGKAVKPNFINVGTGFDLYLQLENDGFKKIKVTSGASELIVNFALDTIAPVINLDEVVVVDKLTVSGTVTKVSSVRVNELDVEVVNGVFSVEIELTDLVIVYAVDSAGNSAYESVEVVFPIVLEEVAPNEV